LELSPVKKKRDLKPLFIDAVEKIKENNIVNSILEKKDLDQDRKSVSSR